MGIEASIQSVLLACSGEPLGRAKGSEFCRGVTTDSRSCREGALFIARRGENADGHKFLADAFSRGALACAIERNWVNQQAQETIEDLREQGLLIIVEDGTQALWDIAQWWRTELSVPVIALTGSNGKTSTKEILRALLQSAVGEGTANDKSFNNHVGLPETLLGASKSDKWVVLEAGMNHAGELSALTAIAQPDVVAILNIGAAHLGNFSSLDEIADAKCELLEGLRADGAALLNADDQILQRGVERAEKRLGRSFEKYFFGTTTVTELQLTKVSAIGLSGTAFSLNGHPVEIPLLGAHHAMNAAAAMLMARTAFPDIPLESFAQGFRNVKGATMRFEAKQIRGVWIVNDAYNANPVSVEASLKTLRAALPGEALGCILGDMLELGQHAKSEHERIGGVAAESGYQLVAALGEFAEATVSGAREGGVKDSFVAKTNAQAVEYLLESIQKSQLGAVLVKGSRGMALENVVQELSEKINALSSTLPTAG